MVKSLSGKIFHSLEIIWQNFRNFFHNNEFLFDFIFLLLYFSEQFGLVYFTILFRKNLDYLPYIVSFFALILLATVSIHRLVMESKNKFVKEKHDEFVLQHYKLKSHYNILENEYNQQYKLSEDLIKDNERLSKENKKLKDIIRKKLKINL